MTEFTEIHSYSSLDKFHNCPHQYKEVRLLRNFKESFSNKSAIEGKKMHSTMEQTFRFKDRDCEDEMLNPAITSTWKNLDKMAKHGPVKIMTEAAMGVKQDLETPCEFWDGFASGNGFRGKMDLLAIAGDVGFIIDWKTGRADYAKMDQLEDMAYLAACKFPNLKAIFLQLCFVKALKTSKSKKINPSREWLQEQKGSIWRRIRRVERCKKEEEWFAQPNGLCKNYCVVSSCPHNGRYTG